MMGGSQGDKLPDLTESVGVCLSDEKLRHKNAGAKSWILFKPYIAFAAHYLLAPRINK